MMWRSQGKDIIDLAAEHQNTFFMMYTNGTLIDEKKAARLAEVGNLTPAISVEGLQAETDARRGKGVFKQILKAMQNLREFGVPFGISVTATRNNADLLLTDEFVDFFFDKQGAIYGWIFQYMPIGRSYTLDLMITPEQRRRMYEREQQIIREKGIFIVDFWNGGPISNGCISAGRPGGYFYIDWNGNVSPCVFFPYSKHNIVQIYKEGGNINTALTSPYFQSLRKWQQEYGYGRPPDQVKNQIVPCPIRDHYRLAYKVISEHGAQPIDPESAEALKDKEYRDGLAAYGDRVSELTADIWEQEYIGPERKRKAA
ncbi:MAG: radical SAM protein [Calditrichaeota bacterium]|nr:MAG: radical SAM protein [Calditrichota bacterium]